MQMPTPSWSTPKPKRPSVTDPTSRVQFEALHLVEETLLEQMLSSMQLLLLDKVIRAANPSLRLIRIRKQSVADTFEASCLATVENYGTAENVL